jgi:large conductance mechanosensitive channel
VGDIFRGHFDGSARGGIPTNARRVPPQRQRAEATQLDAIASNECVGDFTKETIDNALKFARVEVRVVGGQPEDEFGSQHRSFPRRVVRNYKRTETRLGWPTPFIVAMQWGSPCRSGRAARRCGSLWEETEMLQGFKQFILRGNVLDLAVAVVIGGAFGAVVAALVKDLITPLIAALIGKPDFSAIEFTVNGSKFPIGDFINAIASFLLIAAAVYFFIVLPMNKLLERMRRGQAAPDPTVKNVLNVSATCLSQHAVVRSVPPHWLRLPPNKKNLAGYP